VLDHGQPLAGSAASSTKVRSTCCCALGRARCPARRAQDPGLLGHGPRPTPPRGVRPPDSVPRGGPARRIRRGPTRPVAAAADAPVPRERLQPEVSRGRAAGPEGGGGLSARNGPMSSGGWGLLGYLGDQPAAPLLRGQLGGCSQPPTLNRPPSQGRSPAPRPRQQGRLSPPPVRPDPPRGQEPGRPTHRSTPCGHASCPRTSLDVRRLSEPSPLAFPPCPQDIPTKNGPADEGRGPRRSASSAGASTVGPAILQHQERSRRQQAHRQQQRWPRALRFRPHHVVRAPPTREPDDPAHGDRLAVAHRRRARAR